MWSCSMWNMKKQISVAHFVPIGLYLFKANNARTETAFLDVFILSLLLTLSNYLVSADLKAYLWEISKQSIPKAKTCSSLVEK